MIKGRVKKELTIETVLERVSPYEIFKFYIPGNWEINQVFCSPLRIDKNPSFLIGNKFGELGFKDFAIAEHKGDIFNFVKIKFGLSSLDSVLRLIDRDLNLGISDGIELPNRTNIEINKSEGVTKKNTLIQIVTRPFNKEELAYWQQYEINIDELKEENVFSIKKAFLNKKLLSLSDLRFGYYFNGTWKIYQPLEKKRKKWLTNTPLTYLDGKENIKDCEEAWITKSKKELILLKKLYKCVVSTQNESLACFSQENVDFIKNNSKKQVVFYDNDKDGKKASLQVTEKFNMLHCNVPDKYYSEGIKDFGDLVKIYGLKAVEKHLKQKNLI